MNSVFTFCFLKIYCTHNVTRNLNKQQWKNSYQKAVKSYKRQDKISISILYQNLFLYILRQFKPTYTRDLPFPFIVFSSILLVPISITSQGQLRQRYKSLNCVYIAFLATDPDVQVRLPVPPDFLRSSVSGMTSTQPREYN
jgi:hypothetical protein